MNLLSLSQVPYSHFRHLVQPAGDLGQDPQETSSRTGSDSNDTPLPAVSARANRRRGGLMFSTEKMASKQGHARARGLRNTAMVVQQNARQQRLPAFLKPEESWQSDQLLSEQGADASVATGSISDSSAPDDTCPMTTPKKTLEFASAEQQCRLQTQHAFIKTSGNPFNPLKWPTYIRSLVRSTPELTTGMKPLFENRRHCGEPIVMDGYDDIGYVLQSTGISKELAAALQVFVFYPPVLALVNMGATESRHEFRHSRDQYRLAERALIDARQKLVDKAREIDPALADHLDEARTHFEFCARVVASMKRTIQNASPAVRHLIPQYLRRIASYKEVLDKSPILRLNAQSSIPLVVATHGMLAGTVLYQAASATQLANGTLALGLNQGLSIAAGATMGIAQAAMAIYGCIQMKKGWKAHRLLEEIRRGIAESSLISEETRQDLLSAKTRQILVNKIGQIGAPAGLTAGQVLMALGTTVIGTPGLIAGVLLIIGSILVKIGAQRYQAKHFSFDPAALDLRKLAGAGTLQDMVRILESLRGPALENIAWLNILREAGKLNRRTGGAQHADPFASLHAACGGLLRADHERSRRNAMTPILRDNASRSLLRDCLDPSCAGVASAAAFIMAEAPKPVDINKAREAITAYKQSSRAQKLAALFAQVKAAGLETQVMQDIVNQLVYRENGRDNRKGAKYRPFLEKETVTQKRKILWNKTKTVYMFKPETLVQALARSNQDALIDHVEAVAYQAIEKATAGEYLYKKRSELLMANEMISQFAALEKAGNRAPEAVIPPRRSAALQAA